MSEISSVVLANVFSIRWAETGSSRVQSRIFSGVRRKTGRMIPRAATTYS